MSWIDILGGFFGPSRYKAITEDLWKMIAILREENKEIRAENVDIRERLGIVEEAEKECQRSYQKTIQQYRDVKEELLFLKRGKS